MLLTSSKVPWQKPTRSPNSPSVREKGNNESKMSTTKVLFACIIWFAIISIIRASLSVNENDKGRRETKQLAQLNSLKQVSALERRRHAMEKAYGERLEKLNKAGSMRIQKAKVSDAVLREEFGLAYPKLMKMFDDNELISIRGFYSSGTNWLRALITTNCPNLTFSHGARSTVLRRDIVMDADGIYGWKHGLLLEDDIQKFIQHGKHRFVIISREAPTWAISAWKMGAMRDIQAHKAAMKKTKTQKPQSVFSPFSFKKTEQSDEVTYSLEKEVDINKYINHQKANETGISGILMELYYGNRRASYQLVADSVVNVRTTVYKNWMQLLLRPEIASRVHFLRYEDLLNDPYNQFKSMVDGLGSSCKLRDEDSFDPLQSTRVKMGKKEKKNFRGKHARAEFCGMIHSEPIYRSIIDKLDQSFEKEALGYVYPETLQEYCDEVFKGEAERSFDTSDLSH